MKYVKFPVDKFLKDNYDYDSEISLAWYHDNKIFFFPTVNSAFLFFEDMNYEEISKVSIKKQHDDINDVMDVTNPHVLLKKIDDSDYLVLVFALYEMMFHGDNIMYCVRSDINLEPKYLNPEYISKLNEKTYAIHSYALTKIYTLTPERISELPLSLLRKFYNIPYFYEVRKNIEEILKIVEKVVSAKMSSRYNGKF